MALFEILLKPKSTASPDRNVLSGEAFEKKYWKGITDDKNFNFIHLKTFPLSNFENPY